LTLSLEILYSNQGTNHWHRRHPAAVPFVSSVHHRPGNIYMIDKGSVC